MVKYLERLPKVQTAVSPALLALGDGDWKMGEGVQVGKSPQGRITDENITLEHFLCKLPQRHLTLASTGLRLNIPSQQYFLLTPSHPITQTSALL